MVMLSVDDFGACYSSLNYLKKFPIDVLKIDASFVHDVQTDPDDRAIMKSIIALARNMGLKIIAEGAETQAQFEFWRLWVVTIFRAMPWGIRYVQATLSDSF